MNRCKGIEHVLNRPSVFARILVKLADVNDTAMMNVRCKEILNHADVRGDILEIGSGTGINFPCLYNNSLIQSYKGIDPNPNMESYFHEFIKPYPHSFDVRLFNYSAAEMHEIPTNSIDTVLMTLVLCSIPDPLPEQALLEIHRVLKPGGKFLFLEHVLASPESSPLVHGIQRAIEPIWAIIGDGCRFKPMKNYFDAMKDVYSSVRYETFEMPVPLFFAQSALKGQLIK